MNGAFGGNGSGKLTQTAGTRIRYLIAPYIGAITRLTKLVYTAAGTAHTLTGVRPIGNTTTTAATAAAGTVINLTADPNPSGNAIAANDLLAVRETDGVTRLYTVSSVSTLAITLTAGLTAGVASGGKVWSFGITTDTDPRTGLAHPTFAAPASAQTTYQDSDSGVLATLGQDEPILFDSNNATAAGTLDYLTYAYTRN